MKVYKLSLVFSTVILFLNACNSAQKNQTSDERHYPQEFVQTGNPVAAYENLDLQAVGNLIPKADNAEEFEYLINSDEGVNNLDLNGDGYADYISVAEYEDRDSNQRGFTLFDKFGANEIQEIARIIFDRDRLDSNGARVLLNGNEQVYGDNYNYENSWLNKSLPIADWLFSKRDNYYQSPYYYNNYPDYYQSYRTVETPVYRTRVVQNFYDSAFVKTANPTIQEIKIKSPYSGRTSDKIFAKLAKPTKEQIEFIRKNPKMPEFVPIKNDKVKELPPKFANKFGRKEEKQENQSEDFRKDKTEKFEEMRNKPERFERENVKPNRPEQSERLDVKPEKQNKSERENIKENKPEKPDKEMKSNDAGENRGNGGGKKGKN